MSRNLYSTSSRPATKPPMTPRKVRTAIPAASGNSRPQSSRSPAPSRSSTNATSSDQDHAHQPLSIKEAIALRRAEARKAQATKGGMQKDLTSLQEDSLSAPLAPKLEEEDILGRLPVRETIERARSTGTLNLASRLLPCIPSFLFEIHLGIKPDRLQSVPDEPVLPPSAPADVPRRGRREAPAWYEAQDLHVLKMWNNEIEEIQHEISLFGSLKIVDFHGNKLSSLPNTFPDLTSLTTLDLSHNRLTSLPANLFALPELSNLNISHNELSSLPLNSPFTAITSVSKKQLTGGSFFAPAITRASSPLPRLLFLDASYNNITAKSVDLQIPKTVTKIDLSGNPLAVNEAECRILIQTFGRLPKLKELRLKSADINDDVFSENLFSFQPFPSIRVLDFGETKITLEATKKALISMKQRLDFQFSEDPPENVASVMVGKRIIKEAWEIELERKEKKKALSGDFDDWNAQYGSSQSSKGHSGEVPHRRSQEVAKEPWELEAEQGLLTEGGKRRARAVAAAASSECKPHPEIGVGNPSAASNNFPLNSNTLAPSLSSPKYYSKLTQTLTLPPSAPPTKAPSHLRAFSMTAPPATVLSTTRSSDLAVPSPTLPLSAIACQPFSQSLRSLVLANRRLDKSFLIPPEGQVVSLPLLEELDLEGCGLPDVIPTIHADVGSGWDSTPRSSEPILPLIAKLFPSLLTLNLSGNLLSNAAFTAVALSGLILATPERKGLKQLRIRGNRITELDGFQKLAESFKGNRQVSEWHLDELDIRDNEIGRLPPEIGLLPMDVFLVDGNIFRVPPRRVWEREGTKGLLSWLRGRIE